MSMSKKDYEMLADVIRKARDAEADVDGLVEMLADALADANPRFQRDRFLRDSQTVRVGEFTAQAFARMRNRDGDFEDLIARARGNAKALREKKTAAARAADVQREVQAFVQAFDPQHDG